MIPSARKIIHLDLDAFFCSVEELRNPSLRGKPFAVGGRPDQRGVVASCSYPARKLGIRSAMPMARAIRLCPELIIISSNYGDYSKISNQVMEHVRALSDLVEQISIDEAFVEVTSNPDSGVSIAQKLQREIREALGLPLSLGVATNKLVAKIANDYGKSTAKGSGPPNAITVVPEGHEAEFLAPLPVRFLWGVGPVTEVHLSEIGIQTIGQLAALSEVELANQFGKSGYYLYRHAHGIDDSLITLYHEVKSISQETTFARDVSDEKQLLSVLKAQSQKIAQRLRKKNLAGTTVKLKIRWPDFTTLTRQVTSTSEISDDKEIYDLVCTLFWKVRKTDQPVRLIGVGVSGFQQRGKQLSLWEISESPPETQILDKNRRLQSAIAELRSRYGNNVFRLPLRKDEVDDQHRN